MWFRSLFESLKPRSTRVIARLGRRQAARRRPPTSRLFIERLEDRSLPSTYYTLTDLATLADWACDLNASRQVVGQTFTVHAFIWHAGTISALRTLRALTRNATAINDVGQVVALARSADDFLTAFRNNPEHST